MTTYTDNHRYEKPEEGQEDWHIPINNSFDKADVDVPVRDKEANLDDYEPHATGTFIATDTGAVYSGDGSDWYLEDWKVSELVAEDAITFPDGTTVTSPGAGSAIDFEKDGSVVVSNAEAANFVASNAASVAVTDDNDGSVTIEVSASDTNTERTDEEIRDVIAAFAEGGDNVTVTHDDAGDTLTVDGLTDEQIQDIVGSMAGTNLSYDDNNNVVNAANTERTDEEIEDVVGALIKGGSNTTVTYDDANDTLTIDATTDARTDEEIEDVIGNALSSEFNYDDAGDTIYIAPNGIVNGRLANDSVTVAGNSVALGNSTSIAHADLSSVGSDDHHTRYTDEEAQDALAAAWSTEVSYDDANDALSLATGGVANSKLANSAVTVTSGNALTGGGTVALGDSTTLAVDESQIDLSELAGVLADATIKATGDTVKWAVDGNDNLLLRNVTDSTNLLAIDQDTGDVTWPQLGDAPAFGSHDHSEAGTASIGNAGLVNSSVTVAGNTVALGGSASIAHADLSSVGSDDHHARYSDEEAQDAIGSMADSTLAYDDAAPSFGVASSSIGLTELNGPFGLTNLITTPIDLASNDLVSGGTTIWDDSAGELVQNINAALATLNQAILNDSGADPNTAGEFRRNGSDVKVYTGGTVKNLTNIGSGGSGGAPTDAPYLTTASDPDLSNETPVSSYPFSLAADTDLDVAGNDLVDGGTPIWDTSAGAVPQNQLGGPSGSLSTYPLDARVDIDEESFEDVVGQMAGSGITYDDSGGVIRASSSGFKQVTTTSDYNASPADSIWADASSSSVTVTLPSPSKSDIVRITALDATNAVILSDNSGEGIQTGSGTTSSIELSLGESITVESNGTTWLVVGDQDSQLDSGSLGTLSTTVDSDDFLIQGVSNLQTQGVAAVSVFPSTTLSEDYSFNWDFARVWDESDSQVDVFVTVNWDNKPSNDISLDYIVYEGSGGSGGGGGGSSGSSHDTVGPFTSNYTTASWQETVIMDTSGGNLTVELPSPSSTGEFTVKKATDAGSVTITAPNTETIDGSTSDLNLSANDKVSRTFVSDGGTSYYII